MDYYEINREIIAYLSCGYKVRSCKNSKETTTVQFSTHWYNIPTEKLMIKKELFSHTLNRNIFINDIGYKKAKISPTLELTKNGKKVVKLSYKNLIIHIDFNFLVRFGSETDFVFKVKGKHSPVLIYDGNRCVGGILPMIIK